MNIRKELKQNLSLSAFMIGFFILLLFFIFNNIRLFYYDTYGYWYLSEVFYTNNGVWNFPNFQNSDDTIKVLFSVRGYFWPIFLAALRFLGFNTLEGYWLFLSIFYSFGYMVCLPAIFESINGIRITLLKRIIFLLIILFLWPGLFAYPASENPAFLCAIFALWFILAIFKETNKLTLIRNVFYALCSGIFLYAAYNIRPTYSYNLYFIIIILLFCIFKKIYDRKKLLYLPIILLGMGLCALPQVGLNLEYLNTVSGKTPLDMNDRSTYLLYEGLVWERYETVINPQVDYPVLLTTNPLGELMLKQENKSLESLGEISKGQFIQMMLKKPIESLGIYTGHLINAIDARYGEFYIKDLSMSRPFRVLCTIIIWFIFLFGLCDKLNRGEHKYKEIKNFMEFLKQYGLVVGYIAISSIISIVGHIEPRYIFTLYILAGIFCAYYFEWEKLWGHIKKHTITIIVSFFVFLGVCSCIWNWTLMSSNYADKVFNDSNHQTLVDDANVAQ